MFNNRFNFKGPISLPHHRKNDTILCIQEVHRRVYQSGIFALLASLPFERTFSVAVIIFAVHKRAGAVFLSDPG